MSKYEEGKEQAYRDLIKQQGGSLDFWEKYEEDNQKVVSELLEKRKK